ncbi:pepsin-like aspartyl protease [Aliiglaciecola lipolytica]|uniref:Peptidase A1 domain-containing protein n=1 Tax=Aliiglaciecola lipolytica E3 TaxID=1127673 RepID=K6YUE9_9ALTE|nr:pepsin-like aspartyl protease [Aliiglaciecola lipolytica]GAC14910.1 hypothetical protein GLIP_2283 [Aliiglaciecola lipolytica E3]
MTRSLLVPISNLYGNGDFTAQILLEGVASPLNLILDTGSSTLVVDAAHIEHLQPIPTTIAQRVAYGMGSWIGPVVKHAVILGHENDNVRLPEVHLAIEQSLDKNTFMLADGILGLAYSELNLAHDIQHYLNQLNIQPASTYPWPAAVFEKNISDLDDILFTSPKHHITPYFDELEKHNLVANQFAFVVHRSSIYRGDPEQDDNALAHHPLNTGILVVGNPKLHSHMHKNDFQTVKVVHDKYYNVNVLSIGLSGQTQIPFPKLEAKHVKSYISNGIVDSGASAMVFPQSVFNQLLAQFSTHNTDFKHLLSTYETFTGKEIGIPLDLVNLDSWPDLIIVLENELGNTAELKLSASTYWQTHAPKKNQISFKITSLPDWPNQAILGLPLLNNYFTIFNRSAGETGTIEFANKHFCPHLMTDKQHQDKQTLKQHFMQHKHIL